MRQRRKSNRSRAAIIVPAHDESSSIDACLRSIAAASARARAIGLSVDVHVVCDACTDDTAQRVRTHGLDPLVVDFRNVGSARAAGASLALAAGAQWLAFTDADTIVSPTWLLDQLFLDADAVCGTIGIAEWGAYGTRMHAHFLATYQDADDHRHIHGANLGVSAEAYLATGGFKPLPSSEDVAMVQSLLDGDFKIAWSAMPRVTTSARPDYRAPDGFGATLERVAAAFRETTTATQSAMSGLRSEIGGAAA